MPGGGLFDPLGVDRVEPGRLPFRPSAVLVVVACGVTLALILIGAAWIRDDGDRGEPRAVGPIIRLPAPPKPIAPPVSAATPLVTPPPSDPDQEVEIQNGVRIIRPRRVPQGQVIPAPGPPLKGP